MCEEGVIFEHSCFYTVIDREVRWPWANKMCVAHGGQLASITSHNMLTTIGNFMRNKLTEKYGNFGDSIGFWWGATYQVHQICGNPLSNDTVAFFSHWICRFDANILIIVFSGRKNEVFKWQRCWMDALGWGKPQQRPWLWLDDGASASKTQTTQRWFRQC